MPAHDQTLILSRSYSPQRIVNRDKAICMIFNNRVTSVLETTDELMGTIKYENFGSLRYVVKAYGRNHGDGNGDLLVYSPSVIHSVKKDYDVIRDVSFTRSHIYKRDNYTCQYCGKEKPDNELNWDHVIPKSKGGPTSWENIVTSCTSCNIKKGNKMLDQIGFTLRKKPTRPSWYQLFRYEITKNTINKTWLPYVIK